MDTPEDIDLGDERSQIKQLIAKGKEQGFLTYHEVNDHLPEGIVDPEQIEDIIGMITDMGIEVHETAPDIESLLLADTVIAADEDVAEDAAAAFVPVDDEFGRTTDPVRMYMREMGTVDLLTREGEIAIARRIEEGLNQALSALADFPYIVEKLLTEYGQVEAGELKLSDVLNGFSSGEALKAGELKPPIAPANVRLLKDEDEEAEEREQDDEADPLSFALNPEEVKERFVALKKITKRFSARSGETGVMIPRPKGCETDFPCTSSSFGLYPSLSISSRAKFGKSSRISACWNGKSWRLARSVRICHARTQSAYCRTTRPISNGRSL